jgi:hypothetical protein
MFRNSIFFTLLFLLFIFCESSVKTNSNLGDNSEEAFAKIDKKNNGAFTKEDRRKAFNKSLSSMEKTKNSLKNNVSYNGYGANLTPKKTSIVSNSEVKPKKERKKKSAYSAPNSLNAQVFSAYSTN